jgi:hypothetical protein
MKKIFFIALILVSNILFCQTKTKTETSKPTKSETENWIKEKIRTHSRDDGDTKDDYILTFEDSNIIIVNNHWGETYGKIKEQITFKMSDIDFISITDKSACVWLKIFLKSGKTYTLYMNGEAQGNESSYQITLNKAFNENNLPERMKKAFSRLIELNGGTPSDIKEPY